VARPVGLFTSALIATLLGVTAKAEEPPRRVRLELPARFSLPPLYPSERLRLAFPIQPLRFTFSEVRPIGLGAALGPTSHFMAESVWFDRGALSLRTRAESVEGLDLDCSGLTCMPTKELSLTGEARFDLGALSGSRVVPETYLYARYKHYANPGGGFVGSRPGQLQLGLGGLLDF
jgi:hypothetical protein